MSADDELRQARREQRQKRNETKLLKRQRRLTRLRQQGWNEASLLQHQQYHKTLAEQERQGARETVPSLAVENDHDARQQETSLHPTAPPANPLTTPENTLRIAVAGCGGWFCNRAHLPALAKLAVKKKVCITVLCGSNHENAVKTLKRNGVSLTVGNSVAVFDTLESYIEYEQRLSGFPGDEGIRSISREQALADVCLLLLPIPKMAAAIGLCLGAGKYVISEKPVSTNSYVSQSLWDAMRFQRAGRRWMVAENWAFKPSVRVARRLIQQELLRQQRKPTSYHLETVQCLDKSGWRHCGYQTYDGGAARDVGVHCLRVLRCLFGDVETVAECKFDANEKQCKLNGTLTHGDFGISGGLCVEQKEKLDQSLQRATLVVDFGPETRIAWNIAKGTFHRHEANEVSILLETVRGDPYVAGGVRELLAAALSWFHENEFGRSPHASPEHAGLSCPECTPEEAFRDAAVVDTMLADCGHSSVASDSQQKPVSSEMMGVRRYLPQPMLSRIDGPISNSLGTTSFRPVEIAWCSSMDDVVYATKWAREHSLELSPVGTCHSSCLFQDNGVCVSTSLMSHVLDFQAYDKETRAYVRVGTGMMLKDLASLLETTGYTIPSFPVLLHQTVGGAIATGSHGSSTRHGTFSDNVIAVRLVSPDGRVRTILPETVKESHVLQSMVVADRNDIVYSDELMRIARCSCGSMGVVTDIVLELSPAALLRRTEVALHMNASDSCQSLRSLALQNEHCWIQWVIGGDEDADEAAAITLSRVNHDEQDASARAYNGRCWYPYGDMMSEMMSKERKRQPGESKHTMQWSFPLDSIDAVIAILKRSRSELTMSVVEFKFLSVSALTTLAPNSVRKDLPEGGTVVALNVWWELDGLKLFEMLEDSLRLVPGAKPHYGKWFSRREAPVAPLPTTESIPHKRVPKPALSVILPIYNAMPWLPIALRDVLKQEVNDEPIEILAGEDASSDGSLEFLVDVARALGERGSIEIVGKDGLVVRELDAAEVEELLEKRSQHVLARSINPALLTPGRDADFLQSDHWSDGGPSADQVATETGARTRLRVLVPKEYVNVGQGAVMTRCLRASEGSYIGHMESDDARPDGAFQEMLYTLLAHPEWDGVTSKTKCIGSDAAGMERYVDWQNAQDTPEKMRSSRFIEIPALHQTGIFRAAAVRMSTRDLSFRDDAKWPVDLHFWLSSFHNGLTVGKVPSVLFYWRQHHGQQTRNHGRLSIANMRRCKSEFLCKNGGPIFKSETTCSVVIEIWSTGQTLEGWVNDLSSELEKQGKTAQVVAVDWKPGRARPVEMETANENKQRRVRLFAFGMEKTRRQVREVFDSEWNDDTHIFVA